MRDGRASLLSVYDKGMVLWAEHDEDERPVAYAPRDKRDRTPWIDPNGRRFGDDAIVLSPPPDNAAPSLASLMVATVHGTVDPAQAAVTRATLLSWALGAWHSLPGHDATAEARMTAEVTAHLAVLDGQPLATLCRWAARYIQHVWMPGERRDPADAPTAVPGQPVPCRHDTEAFVLGVTGFVAVTTPELDEELHAHYALGGEWAHRATGRLWDGTG